MHALLTTVLDLVGMLLLVAALAVLCWSLHPAAGLAVAGGGLLGASWVIDLRLEAARKRAARKSR